MCRSVLFILTVLVLLVTPASAIGQEATPAPACANGWHPAVGALSLDRGDVEWFLCSPSEAFRTVLGVSDDVVLIHEFAPEFRQIIALDSDDGSELWRKPSGMMATAPGPAYIHGIVVLPIEDSDGPALIGVNALTGQEQLRIQSGELPVLHTPIATIIADPFGPTGPSPVRGIDRETGEELWHSDIVLADLSGSSVGRSSATASDGTAVLPTGESISGIDLATGALLWEAPHLAHVVAADGIVVGIEDGDRPGAMVAALDIATGERLWAARGNASYGGFLAVGDGLVVVLRAGQSEFVAYELANGTERWRARPTFRVEPQLTSGDSVVALWEGTIAVISTSDGATIWSVTVPFGSPLMNSVGTNGEVVVVGINSLPWSD